MNNQQTQPINQTTNTQAVVTTPVNPQEAGPSKLKSLNIRKIALLLLVLLVATNLILGAYYLISRNKPKTQITDQQFRISNLKIEKAGLVRVYQEDNGKQGKLISSTLIKDNFQDDLVIKFSQPLEKGKTYLIVYEPQTLEAYLVFGAKVPEELEKQVKVLDKISL